MGGPLKAIEANQCNTCGVAAADTQPPRLFQFLDPKIRPIATPSRRFNLVDMQFIKKEVEKLLAPGVIEPSRSPWRAQVLVTKDERHKRRMVIDFSQTINRFTALDAYPLPRIDQQVNELAKCKWFSTLDLKSTYYQVPLATEDRAYTAFEADGKLIMIAILRSFLTPRRKLTSLSMTRNLLLPLLKLTSLGTAYLRDP